MIRYTSRAVVLLLALSLVAVACGDEEEGPGPAEPGPFADGPLTEVPAIPPELEDFADEWPAPNRTLDNARATFESGITADTIGDLEVAWSVPIGVAADWGAAASTPLIADGIVYFQDLLSNVVALDLQDGSEHWRAEMNSAAIGPNGPAIGWGKVFVQDGGHHALGLDLATGEQLWRTSMRTAAGSHQPQAYGGLVLTGTGAGAPSEGPDHAGGRESYVGGTSGYAYALDQETGHIVWEFQVVEEGFWGNPDVNSGGGLWYPPSVDVDRGLSFWGTGNPAPFPGTIDHPNASSRPGPNLYTNAMIALDLGSGGLDWYHQVKPRDLFDLDFQSGPVLATADIDGSSQDLAIGSGKLGTVYAFDRGSGELIWERPVGEHQNHELQELPPDEEVVWVLPGVWGGVETPLAYAEGTLYVLASNLPSPYTATGFEAETAADAVVGTEGRTQLEEATAEFYAIDVSTGEVEWSIEIDRPAFGGATVVNDLVLTATLDGEILALDRADGSVVWEHQAPGGIIAWPAIAGDTIVWPIGLGAEPQLLALRLDP